MQPLLLSLLLVALGGGLGGVARYWVAGMVARRWGDAFPWGTLAVNGSGAAGIGVVAALLLTGPAGAHPPLWSLLVVGMLGSYTTVSAFSLQTLTLARDGRPLQAALNVAGSLALCLAAAAGGFAAGAAVSGG